VNDGLVPETVHRIRALYAEIFVADMAPDTTPVPVIVLPPIDVAFETVTQFPK
jgi:hypothetical protein